MGLRRSSHRNERPLRRIPVRWDLLGKDLCTCECHLGESPHRNQICKCHPAYKELFPFDKTASPVVQLNQREVSDGTAS